MKTFLSRAALAAGLATALAGCYVYDPYYHPHPHVSHAAAMDRYWHAALGAMRDQGLQIVREDRTAGVIEGRRGGRTVSARVAPQSDGRYRVEFNTAGALSEDPSLPDRVSRAYDARLGR
jgi:hypothetical protein